MIIFKYLQILGVISITMDHGNKNFNLKYSKKNKLK